MNTRHLTAIVLTGSTLLSANAKAGDLVGFLKSQSLSSTELILSATQLRDLGIETRFFTDLNGSSRDLSPTELVKVEVHEEGRAINFSSFDGYARTVDVYEASNPRNIQ